MTTVSPRGAFTFPLNYETWWSTSYPVPTSSIDELGHMTAVHYPVALEYATAAFLTHTLRAQPPEYVMADLHIAYRREVTMERSPAALHVRLTLVGTTTFGIQAVLVDSEKVACAMADIRYVAWDRLARAKQALDADQRKTLERCVNLIT